MLIVIGIIIVAILFLQFYNSNKWMEFGEPRPRDEDQDQP